MTDAELAHGDNPVQRLLEQRPASKADEQKLVDTIELFPEWKATAVHPGRVKPRIVSHVVAPKHTRSGLCRTQAREWHSRSGAGIDV